MTELKEHFTAQLHADQERALKSIEPLSVAASILGDLYRLLNGPLYPKGKSAEIAKRLDACTQSDLPINLYAVLAAPTAERELPYVANAVGVFKRRNLRVTATAIVVDWPPKPSRTPILEPTPEILQHVENKILQTGRFEQIEKLDYKLEDEEGLDPELRQWLVGFLKRQRSYVDVERIIGFEANTELAIRQQIGKLIAGASPEGLTLGLTTEYNPQLLRCYGDIFLANIDVRGKL